MTALTMPSSSADTISARCVISMREELIGDPQPQRVDQQSDDEAFHGAEDNAAHARDEPGGHSRAGLHAELGIEEDGAAQRIGPPPPLRVRATRRRMGPRRRPATDDGLFRLAEPVHRQRSARACETRSGHETGTRDSRRPWRCRG